MAYAHVQSTSAQRTGVTTGTLAYSSNLGAGNLAIIDYAIFVQSVSSMTWSVGSSATPSTPTGAEANNATGSIRVGCRYTPNTASGAHTISTTLSSSGDFTLAVHEYSGIDTATGFDKAAIGTGSGTSPATSATGTLVQANNLVHAAFTHDQGNLTLTQGSGYTARQSITNGTTGMPILTEDQRVTATTGVTGTGTIGSSANWAIFVAVFMEAAAAAATSLVMPHNPLAAMLGR